MQYEMCVEMWSLDAWKPNDGPALIEAVFDPEPYRTMTNDLRA